MWGAGVGSQAPVEVRSGLGVEVTGSQEDRQGQRAAETALSQLALLQQRTGVQGPRDLVSLEETTPIPEQNTHTALTSGVGRGEIPP